MFNSTLLQALTLATWQTIYMVFISSFVSIALGLVVGTLLFASRSGGILANKTLNRVLGVIVNITRSVPYVILMIAIIPLTRFLVGTSIGTNAAIVSLTLAAIPFYARIVENALSDLPAGLVEAALAMAATPFQTIWKALIPEALPALISGGTLTIISLIGYSAMAGAVGGGGLGELAVQYGYERFNPVVILWTVVILVILVQLIQSVGDKLAAARKAKPIGYLCILLWIASIVFIVVQALPQKIPELKVGVMSGVNADIMKVAKKVALTDYGLNLKIVTFDDYVLPNTALNSGDIDANIFQHTPYLDAQIKARHYKLSPIAATFVYPLGFYSKHIKTIGQLKYHAVIAIPNDPSNEGRALRLLALKHVIGLKKSAGLFGTPADITSNPKDLQFKLLAVAQLPRVFKSAALVALTDDFVKVAGFTPNQAVLREGPHAPYANVIVVQTSRRHDAVFEKLIAAMHSKAVLDKTLQLFPDGEAIPAWKAH